MSERTRADHRGATVSERTPAPGSVTGRAGRRGRLGTVGQAQASRVAAEAASWRRSGRGDRFGG